MESNKELSIMPASIARQKLDLLFQARTDNLLVSIQNKIEAAIDRCVSSTEISSDEYRYCEKTLLQLGYKITGDGGDVWIDW